MDKVIIGEIVNTHGIRGELKVKISTDFVDERFAKGNHLTIDFHGQNVDVTVKSYRIHKNHVLVLFEGNENINLVEKYKGCTLLADKDLDLLEEGEYYIGDLIGCEVFDKGESIGIVKDLYLYDHHDVLVVKGKKTIMIPYVEAFVKDEDIENKRIDVELIEGFYNED